MSPPNEPRLGPILKQALSASAGIVTSMLWPFLVLVVFAVRIAVALWWVPVAYLAYTAFK